MHLGVVGSGFEPRPSISRGHTCNQTLYTPVIGSYSLREGLGESSRQPSGDSREGRPARILSILPPSPSLVLGFRTEAAGAQGEGMDSMSE